MNSSIRVALLATAAAVATLSIACGGGDSTASSTTSTTTTIRGVRPSTTAQLKILSPTEGQVVKGTNVSVKLEVTGATIIADHGGGHDDVKADEVHLHLSLDGRLVSMTFGDSDELTDVAPGRHTLTAEVVAGDHAPFANKVEATTSFTVE